MRQNKKKFNQKELTDVLHLPVSNAKRKVKSTNYYKFVALYTTLTSYAIKCVLEKLNSFTVDCQKIDINYNFQRCDFEFLSTDEKKNLETISNKNCRQNIINIPNLILSSTLHRKCKQIQKLFII